MKRNNIFLIIFGLIILIAGIGIGCYFYKTKKSEDKIDDLKEKMTTEALNDEELQTGTQNDELNYYLINGEKIQECMKDLYLENQDFIGWLSIDNTAIDYPVMQCRSDMNYYINRDFDKNYSGAGSIFANIASNIKTPSDNILIYGHHMHSDTMFHSLSDYKNEEYYKEHKFITFNSLYRNGTYEVIAAFRTKITDNDGGFEYYKFFDATTKEEFDDYIKNITELSTYKFDSSAKYGDKLITLSTCAYHTKNGRFVVVAKQIAGKEITEKSRCLGEIKTN